MKTLAVLCGIGLGVLWLIGLGNPNATPWLTWLDGIGAVLSFVVAGIIRPNLTRTNDLYSTGLLSIGLFIVAVMGMATNGRPWQNWLTFAFACVMGLATLTGGRGGRRYLRATDETVKEHTRLRKVG